MRVAWFLTLAILLLILSNPSFAKPEIETFPQNAYLIDHINPALSDVNSLYIAVILRGAYNEPYLSLTAQIEKQLKGVFRDSDINVIDTVVDANSPLFLIAKRRFDSVSNLRFHPANASEFRIEVDLLNLANTDQCVFRLQTSFVKNAVLEDAPKANIKADVWKYEPVMCVVKSTDLTESVAAETLNQTRAFIVAWSTANAPDANQPRPPSGKAGVDKEAKPIKQQAVESNYVASKNSKVFHKADCPFAQQILPKNLVSYSSREKAIAAGKRPCKRCNP